MAIVGDTSLPLQLDLVTFTRALEQQPLRLGCAKSFGHSASAYDAARSAIAGYSDLVATFLERVERTALPHVDVLFDERTAERAELHRVVEEARSTLASANDGGNVSLERLRDAHREVERLLVRLRAKLTEEAVLPAVASGNRCAEAP